MPLSKLIVQIYGVILEVGLWLALLGAIIGGWQANGFVGAMSQYAKLFLASLPEHSFLRRRKCFAA